MTTPVVLITGALTGIGRATALAFSAPGDGCLLLNDPLKIIVNANQWPK